MGRTRITMIMVAGLALAASMPAAAAETTEVAVTGASATGGTVSLTGTIAFGTDATGPILVGEDPEGDATVSGVGIDFGDVTIATNPTTRRLTYAIEVYDMLPVAGQSAPFYGYTLPISVDGADNASFLAAGNAGANFPPATGPWRALCSAPAGSYTCPTPLNGTMDASGITIQLPFSSAGIQPGSVVEPGSAVACGGGICTTLWAGLLFNNTAGDSGFLAGYKVPGQVRVGIAAAGTPPSEVATTTNATVAADGTWTAALAAPGAGAHVVVARSCWGNAESLQCAEGSSTVTV